MKKILVICYSDLDKDPRVLTQINALKNSYKVTASGFKSPKIENVAFIQLTNPETKNIAEKLLRVIYILFGNASSSYWFYGNRNNFKKIVTNQFDLIIANDLDVLPLACKLKEKMKSKVIFDAHEYYLDSGQKTGLRKRLEIRFRKLICSKYFTRIDFFVTVGPRIKEIYESQFNSTFEVIMNLPPYYDLVPKSINRSNVKIVHHGVALPKRQLETMIDLMRYLDSRYSLTFYLVVNKYWEAYYKRLQDHANEVSKNIKFKNPVPYDSISSELNNYDIGLFVLPPTNINYKFALPNKLFEFIQARLMLVIGPSPEMADIVSKNDLGIVSKTFEPRIIAKQIDSTSKSQMMKFKVNSHKVAENYSFTTNKNKWLKVLSRVISE